MWVRMLPGNSTDDANGGVGTAKSGNGDPRGKHQRV
jgi:hypothetical protein